MKQKNFSVIGLGKLGVCIATCLAQAGYRVIGLDINPKTIDFINQNKPPVREPQLQELMKKAGKNLRATSSYKQVIENSDISFLIVPTPSKKNGHFSDQYLRQALLPLAKELSNKNTYHLFVVTSTVSPGTIQESLIPLIEKYSGKKLNQDFGVCYNPEFIALGSIIRDILNPDLVLLGESDQRAGNCLIKIYQKMCLNKPYIARMSIISAEIAKISLNAFITMKISFANTLGNLSERIPGAEIDKITRALGADKRVSPYYLKAGPAYGGPCFPRDNRAFAAFAKSYRYDAKLAKTTDQVNQLQIKLLLKKIKNICQNSRAKKITILGLSYKPDTPVIEESMALFLIKDLLKRRLSVTVYDPLAQENAKTIFADKINYASDLRQVLSVSEIIVLALPTQEFEQIDESLLKGRKIIIDCWRLWQHKPWIKKHHYFPLGKK